jgi:hypothetical protein
LTKTAAQLHTLIQQSAKVQRAYDFNHFVVLPLPDPQGVTCYYFRNKSRLFLGKLEPYFIISGDEIPLDHTNYWEEWEQQLPNLHMMDVDSSSHMTLLSEPKVYETITAFCQMLYSEKEISAEILKSFKRKTKKTHGSLSLNTLKKKANKKTKKKK